MDSDSRIKNVYLTHMLNPPLFCHYKSYESINLHSTVLFSAYNDELEGDMDNVNATFVFTSRRNIYDAKKALSR